MGFLDRYFRGEAVSDAEYGAKEAEEVRTVERKEPVAPAAVPRKPAATRMPSAKPRASTATQPGMDNVVDFSRARAVADTDKPTTSFMRETAAFTRDPSGFTKEFESQSGGVSFGGGKPRGGITETAEAYVVFKRLKDFTMASQVADKMVERKIVILNLESCDDEIARRVLDFIGGVAYACGSMVKRIAGRVFMITPKGVNADGEFFDELREAGAAEIRYDD